MTLGTGQPQRDTVGANQALHDRGLASALSATIPASDALTITRGDDVLTEIQNTNDYLRSQAGVSWPTPWHPYKLRPTVDSRKGNINVGWNAAAQPGSPPGYRVQAAPYRDVSIGGESYAEAMNYSPAPLTDGLGALRGGSYREPASELRPGFGQTGGAVAMLPLLALGGLVWWMLSRSPETDSEVSGFR